MMNIANPKDGVASGGNMARGKKTSSFP